MDVNLRDSGLIVLAVRVNGIDRIKIFNLQREAHLDDYNNIVKLLSQQFGAHRHTVDAPVSIRNLFDFKQQE